MAIFTPSLAAILFVGPPPPRAPRIGGIDPVEQARWLMLSILFDTPRTVQDVAKMLREPVRKWGAIIYGRRDPSLRDLASWAYALDREIGFKLVPRGP